MFTKPIMEYTPIRICPTGISDGKTKAMNPLSASYLGHIILYEEFLEYKNKILGYVKFTSKIPSKFLNISHSDAKNTLLRGLVEEHLDRQHEAAERFLKDKEILVHSFFYRTTSNETTLSGIAVIEKVERLSFLETLHPANPLFILRFGEGLYEKFIITPRSVIDII